MLYMYITVFFSNYFCDGVSDYGVCQCFIFVFFCSLLFSLFLSILFYCFYPTFYVILFFYSIEAYHLGIISVCACAHVCVYVRVRSDCILHRL